MLRGLVKAVLIASIAFLSVACSTMAVASVEVVPAGPLVTVTTQGGKCVNGPCGSTIVIERDGRVHRVAPGAAELGKAPAEALRALDAAVKTTNFEAIRARKFTGQCPTAYDGQEIIYEFGTPTGTVRIGSCETEIDPNQPVFAAVLAAHLPGRFHQAQIPDECARSIARIDRFCTFSTAAPHVHLERVFYG